MLHFYKFAIPSVSLIVLISLSACSDIRSMPENDNQQSSLKAGFSSPILSTFQTEDTEGTNDLEQSYNELQEIDNVQQSVVNTAEFEVLENEDGSVTIKRYIGSGGDVVIPAEIDGKPVSAIGNVVGTTGAFEDCTNITSVVIPDGVVEIQDNAFYGCTNLEVVTVPSSVILLRNCAFSDCPKLHAIYFEGNAPQQANYVFDATEDVTIYYQKGTTGWDDPWYNRSTVQYSPLEILADRINFVALTPQEN